jgi:arginyl-tRNA--protein-N-Asp/Glu arginylyltransferase
MKYPDTNNFPIYENEKDIEFFLKGINATLKRINNLSYRLKYTDKDAYTKYRSLFTDLQNKRNQARIALKIARLDNAFTKAQEYLEKDIPR